MVQVIWIPEIRTSAEFAGSAIIGCVQALAGRYFRQSAVVPGREFHPRETSSMRLRLFSFLAVLGICVLSTVSAHAQEKLSWKFTAGESLKYVVTQSTDMQMSVAGQKQSLTMSQTMDMSWKISDVASNGDVTMNQAIERVQVSSDGGLIGGFKYDSSDSAPPESAIAKTMADVFSKIINENFAVTMKPTGQIASVDVPEPLVKALASGGGTSVMNEETLKQIMTQSAVTLPEKPVKKGESWENTQNVDLQFGVMTISSVLTYTGNDPSTGLAQITMKPTISIKSKEGQPQQVTLKKSEGGGKVAFDAVTGRIARSDMDLTMEISIRQFGQQVEQTVKQKTSMVLNP